MASVFFYVKQVSGKKGQGCVKEGRRATQEAKG
jgi:hypothetical protein